MYSPRMAIQRRKNRKESQKLELEEHLRKEKKVKFKKTIGQPPLASQQHASEADARVEMDRAISEDNNHLIPKN